MNSFKKKRRQIAALKRREADIIKWAAVVQKYNNVKKADKATRKALAHAKRKLKRAEVDVANTKRALGGMYS